MEGDGAGHFLHSNERGIQGDPLAMITYVLGILSLIRNLLISHPGVNHPWYTNDTGKGGTFDGIRRHLDKLTARGPQWGYFPDLTNSISVMSIWNVLQKETFFCGYDLKIVTGIRYLGSFVGIEAA